MILVELLLLLLAGGLGLWGAHWSLATVLGVTALRGQTGDATVALAAGQQGMLWFGAGVALVALARGATHFRRGQHVRTPLLLPAVYAATSLGLVVQYGYGNPYVPGWTGPAFAQGVFYGSVIVAGILAIPGDLAGLIHRFRPALAATVVLLFAALYLFGTEPGGSGARINLGPIQPIEIVKVAAVLFLGSWLGQRAAKLRFQRMKLLSLSFPRPRLLLPAVGALLGALSGLFLVHDLGPTLILGGVFLGLFYVVTRSGGWVLLSLSGLAAMLAFFGLFPELAPAASVELRLRMWLDPWYNALAHGDQLVAAFWTMAAGGLTGTGIGSGWPGALPAGHTDLAFAHVVEELGLAGGLIYLACLGTAITDGLRVAIHNRTPERVLMATALALLLGWQAAVILGGTLGLIPLTGVVVPFLSYGKSGMAAFLGVAALIARLGEDGQVRQDTDELRELRDGVLRLQVAVVGVVVLFGATTAVRALWHRDEVTLRGAVTTLGDGTPRLIADPRIAALAASIRRGPILDRNGIVLAENVEQDKRLYPLGSALGTLLGPPEGGLLRARWSVERQQDTVLRGWPDRSDAPSIWLAAFPAAEGTVERAVMAVPGGVPESDAERLAATRRAEDLGSSGGLRRVTLAAPDYSGLLPIVRMPLAERAAAVAALSADVAPRTVRLSLEARLQAALAAQVKTAAARSKVGAAAAVVLDPATGEILARAQWPDYDPAGTDWRALRLQADPKFMGIYGAWSDKTGLHGVFQAGSVFKILSAVVALREGVVSTTGEGSCPTTADPVFSCDQRSEGRVSFTLPGWSRPIHDHGDGGGEGKLDLVGAITRSSNVYFGQLALSLGSLPYRKLREEGVEFGNPGLLSEAEGPWTGLGSAGSRRLAQTGFGQGAGSWSVVQAARLLGAVANGGVYRRCPAEMLFGSVCVATPILPTGSDVAPILSGMLGVMQRGTGARLTEPKGIRVYGKTGTADAPGTADERPWGIKPGKETAPHSWFFAIAEPEENASCVADAPGRYVVAAVVPHGGFGASAAGPLVMATLQEMQTLGYFPKVP